MFRIGNITIDRCDGCNKIKRIISTEEIRLSQGTGDFGYDLKYCKACHNDDDIYIKAIRRLRINKDKEK